MNGRNERGVDPYFRGIAEIRQNWSWFLGLGLLQLFLGLAVISFSYYATVFSVILFGIALIGAGVMQFIHAFLSQKWSGLFLTILLGLLYIVTGFLCVTKPTASAINLTLWIAAFCFIAGLFRMFTALVYRFDHWEWVFFNGLITFILGILIFSDWPISGLWVIGLFIGIDMILSGWSWILLSLATRRHLS